jgi:hypothetical protein
MRGAAGAWMREAFASVLAGALLASAAPGAARADGRDDSLLAGTWSAVYLGRVDVERAASNFPWNDEEQRAALNNRLAVLGRVEFRQRFSLFAKGASGFRTDGDYQNNRFVLEQGHAGFDLLKGAVRGRLFARERVYRTDQRLLKTLSDESPMFSSRGEGLALEVAAGSLVSLGLVESILKDEIDAHGGLPSFHGGGDIFRALRLQGVQRNRWHAGLTLSQVRSTRGGDHVTIGADLGFRVRGVDLLADLARLQEGTWEDLRESSLFGLRPSARDTGRSHSLFSENNAFAAEIEGLNFDMKRFGAAGIVPGYRFGGNGFEDRSGEIVAGIEEGCVLAWWKPAESDALVSIDAAAGNDAGRDFKRLAAQARLRYRGGFEMRESVLCRTGERISAAVSLIDDNAFSRLALTSRIDDCGAKNELSYLAEGAINLGSRIAVKSVLYLYRSRAGCYHVELEFRPRERYLLQVTFGSFRPAYEGLALGNAMELDAPQTDRFIQLFTRVWFGREGAQ